MLGRFVAHGRIYSLTRYEDNSRFRHPTKINTAILQGADLSDVFPMTSTACLGILSTEQIGSQCPTSGRTVGK
jgi:hypothetical protein